MNILFLDFASQKQFVALVDEKKVLAYKEIDDHKEEAAMMPLIESMADMSKVTHVACALGPGGFTSLRVGVALTNALSYGLGIPSAGVHLSDLWSEAGKEQANDFVWLHSTRKTSLFIRGFGTFETNWPEPTVISLDDAKMIAGSAVGELIPEHLQAFSNMQMLPITSYQSVLPNVLSALAYKENQTLLPWYGREA